MSATPQQRLIDGVIAASKAVRRTYANQRRRSRSAVDIATAREAITGHLLAELSGTATVAGFLPLPTEPLDTALLERLRAAGTPVLVPLTRPDEPLDWVEYTGSTRPGALGILEPVGPTLGPEAIAGAEVVLVPALEVDGNGIRLGRGGGHYDRTLAGFAGRTIAVVFDDELVERGLPAASFDVPVTAVVTPSGLDRF